MIFASLGTMDMPFYRMAKAVDEFAAQTNEEVIVQTGYTDYSYKYAHPFDFCTKSQMQEYLSSANLLILQGGWGAISEAMDLGKKIVVIPRHNVTEHIHDQVQLIRKLDEMQCVIGVFDETKLSDAIKKAENFEFKQIQKGNAECIIVQQLDKWFAI